MDLRLERIEKKTALLEELHSKYPLAYDRESEASKAEPFGDRGGIECGPGWADILDNLGQVLTVLGIRVGQVKQKFGTLRVYQAWGQQVSKEVNAAAEAAIELACWLSRYTCEACGAPGSARGRVVGDAWYRTRCDECEADVDTFNHMRKAK